ncbi:trihelix transcription factor PTL [Mercurialis annua]|uniref:trihelix transcription factor PTL n=1 Tax=Mercurialis annua TaxID=3986 RepID=UPI002160D138|nr:trihelix transcription factor PTL [Mercurialis annua]
MEDHHHNHHSQYNIDLRQFISGRPTLNHFPPPPPPPPPDHLFSSIHRSLHPPPLLPHGQPYDMMYMMHRGGGGGLHEFHSDSSAAAAGGGGGGCVPSSGAVSGAANSSGTLSGLEAEGGCSFGGDGGTGRWPRQETLTLLEIRSRLDSKFKEANQKGPLWDEVSRILSEEHGYQRNGKKCREKFENLYKYYKKTKEGKAGRQDGKHYRFFRQLEALYGETSNSTSMLPNSTQFVANSTTLQFHNSNTIQPNQEIFHSQKLCDSLSLSNSSEFGTSSSEENDLSTDALVENDSTERKKKRRDGRNWKAKIKEFIDSQMRKLIEKQESWLEKLTKTIEQKEQERISREEEWRKQECARIDREHKFWAKERAWIEARDATLMEALQKITGRDQLDASSPHPNEIIRNTSENLNESDQTIVKISEHQSWPDSEITRLMQLRAGMESRFNHCGCIEEEEALWEEIAAKISCLGYEKSALMCKEKWEIINNFMRKTKENHSKKRKENCYNFQSNDHHQSMYNQGSGPYCEINDQGQESSSPANSNAVGDSCFRFMMSDGENFWENYGLKLSKGDHPNNQ